MEVFIRSSNSWEKCDLIKENVKTAVVQVHFDKGILSKIFGDNKVYRNSGYHIIKKRKNFIRGINESRSSLSGR